MFQTNTMSGTMAATNFNMTLKSYYRNYVVQPLSFNQASTFASYYTGTIAAGWWGLAPWTLATSLNMQAEQSFLYEQSVTTNTLDAPVVSFYVHNNSYRTTSMMKFGGWDWMGFRSDQDN